MPSDVSKTFFPELDKKLRTAADRSRPVLDASGYKNADRLFRRAASGVRALVRISPKLKNVVNKDYIQLQIDPPKLAVLIDFIATIPFQHADIYAKDILCHVYDWSAATKTSPQVSPKDLRESADQYFAPKSIVSLIVELIGPYQGRVYEPAAASSGIPYHQCRFSPTASRNL